MPVEVFGQLLPVVALSEAEAQLSGVPAAPGKAESPGRPGARGLENGWEVPSSYSP
jgi:hypothetical protein